MMINDAIKNGKQIGKDKIKQASSRFVSFWKFVGAVVKDVYIHTFFRDNVSLMAAAISFYAMLSIIPLLLVFVSISGYVLNSSEYAFQKVSEFLVAVVPSSTTSTISCSGRN